MQVLTTLQQLVWMHESHCGEPVCTPHEPAPPLEELDAPPLDEPPPPLEELDAPPELEPGMPGVGRPPPRPPPPIPPPDDEPPLDEPLVELPEELDALFASPGFGASIGTAQAATIAAVATNTIPTKTFSIRPDSSEVAALRCATQRR
jgi:hypothetical protein